MQCVIFQCGEKGNRVRDNVHRFGLTEEDQANLLRAIGVFVRTAIADALGPIERRLTLIESNGLRWVGTWQRGCVYERHDICLHDNAMWIALTKIDPLTQPGKSQEWQLVTKSPRVPTQGGARSSSTIERRT